MTMFNVHLELHERKVTEDLLIFLADELQTYHASVGQSPRGYLSVRLTLPAENTLQATSTAIAVVERLAGAHTIVAEVMTEDEFDAREGFDHVPDLMSVTEISKEYDVSRQGVLKMITSGRFATATRIGDSWAVTRTEVLEKKPRTVSEATAALVAGSRKRDTIPHGPEVG